MPQFDLLIKGGQVVDPGAASSASSTSRSIGDRIAAVDRDLPTENAGEVVDAAGQIVTPGLVDLHTHVYWGVTYWGIEADPIAARTGVTTWLDVGSSGGYTFPGFRRWIAEPSRARIYALLNRRRSAWSGRPRSSRTSTTSTSPLAERITNDNRDLDPRRQGAHRPQHDPRHRHRAAASCARELADRVQLPLMVHIGAGPPDPRRDRRAMLRPGDILTHCFTGDDNRIVDRRARSSCRRQASSGSAAWSWTSATGPARSRSRPPRRCSPAACRRT